MDPWIRPSDSRVFDCPASLRMRNAAGAQVETEAMATGTRLHDLVAFEFALNDAQAAKTSLGDLPDWAEEMVDDALQILRELRAQFPNYTVHIEAPLTMGHQVGLARETWRGTADYMMVSPDGHHVVVADVKTGLMPVPANSTQLLSYTVGALDLAPDLEHSTSVVIQPRSTNRVDIAEFTRADLQQFIAKMSILVPLALSPSAPFQAGGHCLYCHAIANCPVGSDYIFKQFAGAATVDWKADTLSNERLAAALSAAPLLEKFVEAAKAEATQRLEAGQEIPGFVLGRRVTQRRWSDTHHFIDAVRDLGLDLDTFAPRKPITPAAALRAVTGEAISALEALVVKPTGTLTVQTEKLNSSGGKVELRQLLPVLFSSIN